jgi:hypothetical protein
MEEYDVRLSDGSIIVVRANSPDEALQIAARRIAEREAAQQPADEQAPTMGPLETAADVMAGVSRGLTPYLGAGTLGAAAGGGLPGAAAGVGAMALSQFVGDPLVDSVNALFGTQLTKPTDALNALMDAAGMPRPQTEAGQMAEKTSAGAAGALGGVGLARSVAAGAAPGTLTQRVAQVAAEAPVAQTVAGATGAAAAEKMRQEGASPLVQMGAGLAGGLAGGMGTSMIGGLRGFGPGGPAGRTMLEQDFGNQTNVTLRVPMGPSATREPIPMTYEDVARDANLAARGGMGSQQAVERLARAAAINPEAAAAADRLGIDVPPDVLIDHTQLKEAIGLTRSMPGTVASAAWVDAVQNAATQADEAIARIDGSADLSEISDAVLQSMNRTQADLQKQADEMYARINARLKGAGQPAAAAAAAPDVAALKQQGFDTEKVYYHGTYQKDFDTFDMSKVGMREVPWYGEGAYLSPDRNIAKRYGDKVIPFYVRGRLLTVDNNNPWPEWLKSGADIKKELENRGYVGLQINATAKSFKYDNKGNVVLDEKGMPVDVEEIMPETVVFDPANIVRADKGPSAQAAPAPIPVDLINSRRLMNEVVKELGGDTKKLTPLERDLMEMSSTGRETPVTYTALMRMKNDVGQALQKATGPYKDVNSGILKRLYGALSEDQLQYAQQVGGDALRSDLRLANQVVAKRKALEDRIVSLFGDERDGSIARKLVSTIQSGAKGDVTGFNRVVRSLPEDLRKRAVASAIAGAAREEKTNGFGFSKYVNLYQGLRRNSEIYKTVATTLGPEGDKFLRDLYEISKRITDARAQVLTTGKANQALVQGLMAEGLVEGILKSTVGRQAVMGATTAATGVAAGPVAGAATAMLTNALTQGQKNRLKAAGDLFASPEWQQLVINVSTQQNVNQRIFNAAKNSDAFRNWAKLSGIDNPDRWLRTTLSAAIGTGIAVGDRQSEVQPRMGREATE